MVGLFGQYPDIELRAVLEVGDDIDLEHLPARVDEALGRLQATAGVRPTDPQVTVRFTAASRQRQIA